MVVRNGVDEEPRIDRCGHPDELRASTRSVLEVDDDRVGVVVARYAVEHRGSGIGRGCPVDADREAQRASLERSALASSSRFADVEQRAEAAGLSRGHPK